MGAEGGVPRDEWPWARDVRPIACTAIDPRGRAVDITLYAPTVAEARQQLLDDGYTEVRVWSDGQMETLFAERRLPRQMTSLVSFAVTGGIHPLDPRPLGSATAFARALILPVVSLVVWVLWTHPSGDVASFARTGAVIGGLWAVVIAPLAILGQALRARAWGRWKDVAFLVRLLRWANITGRSRTAFQYDTWYAQALAGMGRLGDGLSLLREWEEAAAVSRMQYLGGLANLYEAAGEEAAEIRCWREALELEPESYPARIDLAFKLIQYEGNVDESAALCASVDVTELSEMQRAFYDWCRAWIAFEEGQSTSTLHLVSEASRRFQSLPDLSPLIPGILAELEALRCLALVRTGQLRLAARAFDVIRDRIGACNPRLFARCTTALTDAPPYRS